MIVEKKMGNGELILSSRMIVEKKKMGNGKLFLPFLMTVEKNDTMSMFLDEIIS